MSLRSFPLPADTCRTACPHERCYQWRLARVAALALSTCPRNRDGFPDASTVRGRRAAKLRLTALHQLSSWREASRRPHLGPGPVSRPSLADALAGRGWPLEGAAR